MPKIGRSGITGKGSEKYFSVALGTLGMFWKKDYHFEEESAYVMVLRERKGVY